MHTIQSAAQDEKSDINLTPMLDVVFILLIFFVVTASFIREHGVPVNTPASSSEPTQDLESITVRVAPNNAFTVNGRRVSRSSLPAYVRGLYAENPDADYVVMVERTSRVGATVAAVDAGRRIGFDVVPITTSD